MNDLFYHGKLPSVGAFLLFFLIFLSARVFPQHRLIGSVHNASNGESIEGVIVFAVEENKYAITDSDGKFSLSDLHHPTVELSFQHLAFHTLNAKVKTQSRESSSLKIYLQPTSIELEEVIISDKKNLSIVDELGQTTDFISSKELVKDLSNTLGATLKNQVGLSLRTMGPAPARPVIRGLGGNRIFISEDDNSTNDLSATSPDHAVSTEPFTIESVEIVRGPQQLIFNSSAMGGWINILREDILTHMPDHLHGFIGAYGESMNKGYLGGGIFEIPFEPLTMRLEATHRNSSDATTPIGKLINTNMSSKNYAVGTSYLFKNGFAGISMREFSSEYGIPGGFIGGHPKGVDITLLRRIFSTKFKYELNFRNITEIEFSLARTYFNQKEFESNNLLGAEFVTRDYQTYLHLTTTKLLFFNEGTLGVSFKNRDFRIGGFVFTPNSETNEIAAFIHQKYFNEKNNFEFAARFTHTSVKPNSNLIPDRSFNSVSFSASYLQQITKIYFAGIQANYSSRAPSLEELYSQGPHLAAYSYETGNSNLSAEEGVGIELNNYIVFESMKFKTSIYYNYFMNYIIPQNTGKINFATLLPIYASNGVEAALFGYEFDSEINFSRNFSFTLASHFVNGKIASTSNYLPQIPPLTLYGNLKYHTDDFNVGIEFNSTLRQNKLGQFEEETAGFFVTSVFLQKHFIFYETIHSFSITLENLFDKEYRNHLSRIKSIAPESGRSLRVNYKIYF